MATRPIFGIFEGGGAKGVAHIGALAACERNDFFFVGVAGSSAGAIVATLIAAGFEADVLLNPAAPKDNILAQYGETPLDLLGEAEWNRAKVFVEKGRQAAAPRGAKGAKGPWRSRWWLWRHRGEIAKGLDQNGWLSTSHAREVLNEILWDQLTFLRAQNGHFTPLPERITFKHFDVADTPEVRPLKIVAANVDTQELAIFDRERTPDMEVALAVAASIAIPGLFEPVMAPGKDGALQRHMDGGAVSNLPVWVFANEKLAFERTSPAYGPVPTVGFTLKPKAGAASAGPAPPDWLAYAGAGLSTVLSGSQSIVAEFLDDLQMIPLHVALGTFGFDGGEKPLVEAYKDGFRCADRDLKHYLIQRPRLVRRELADFHAAIRKALVQRLPKPRRRRSILLRACIVQRSGSDVFQVTYSHNMDEDADDRLTLDRRGRASPLAMLEREAQFLRVWDAMPSTPTTPDYMTKYERALANKRVRAIIAMPIFADLGAWDEPVPGKRPDPCGVVAIDSNRDFELERAFYDPTFMSLMQAQSTLLYAALRTEPPRG